MSTDTTLYPLTATSSPVKLGIYLVDATGRCKCRVVAPPCEGAYLAPAPDYFLVQYETTGTYAFARLSGGTRRQFGMALRTIDLFSVVTTVAEVEGTNAVVGVVGARKLGRLACRPEYVVAS